MKKLGLFLSVVLLASIPSIGRAQPSFTLSEARDRALKTHPRITLAQLRVLLSREGVVEARSAYFPTIGLNATAVDSGEQTTRIASGSLSNSQIYDHTGVGATFTMILTDFGRTANLTAAAKARNQAAEANVLATREQLLLEVDAAYLDALKALEVQRVAEKTVRARQAFFDRTQALAQNQIKSELDVRLARVSLDEARLLVDDAANQWQAAVATLANLTGDKSILSGVKLEDPAFSDNLPSNADHLISQALAARPDLNQQRAEIQASRYSASAAKDARLPTVSVGAALGVVPTSDPHFQHNYAAGGVNISVPIFAGGLYSARQHEAEISALEAQAAFDESAANAERDVRLAWLAASHARERIGLTENLRQNAEIALNLASARFDQGITSIVELTQAELFETSAEIAQTEAKYDYRIRREMLDYQTGALR